MGIEPQTYCKLNGTETTIHTWSGFLYLNITGVFSRAGGTLPEVFLLSETYFLYLPIWLM